MKNIAVCLNFKQKAQELLLGQSMYERLYKVFKKRAHNSGKEDFHSLLAVLRFSDVHVYAQQTIIMQSLIPQQLYFYSCTKM